MNIDLQKGVSLRPWKMSDLPHLVLYANNYQIAKNLMDVFPHPYLETDGINFISRCEKVDPPHIFAITQDDMAIGGIGLHLQTDIFKKNAELGYWLAEDFWGKGIITLAIRGILNYSFTTFNIDRIFARPFGSNVASQKALEKNGFTLEAKLSKTIYKFNQYEDECIYSIRKKSS